MPKMQQTDTPIDEAVLAMIAAEAEAEAIRAEMRALRQRLESAESRAITLRDQVERSLAPLLGDRTVKKIDLPGGLSGELRRSRYAPVEVTGEYPDKFARFKREPDKVAIRKALLRGDFVPGAELGERRVYLKIKEAK